MDKYLLSASTMSELLPKLARTSCELGAQGFLVEHVETMVVSDGDDERYSRVLCSIYYHETDSLRVRKAYALALSSVISIDDLAGVRATES